jgi:hypothetical protein
MARVDFYQTVLRDKGLLYGEVAMGRNSAAHQDHEYDILKAGLGMYLKVVADFRVVVEGNYTVRDHRYVDSSYDLKREDKIYYLTASVSRPFLVDWLDLGVKVEYVHNDSNIDDFNYRKLATFLSLVATY